MPADAQTARDSGLIEEAGIRHIVIRPDDVVQVLARKGSRILVRIADQEFEADIINEVESPSGGIMCQMRPIGVQFLNGQYEA